MAEKQAKLVTRERKLAVERQRRQGAESKVKNQEVQQRQQLDKIAELEREIEK